MRDFKDLMALVTGAGSGIGRAVALALAAEGATVALVGRRAQPLAEVASAARAGGATVLEMPADLGVDADIARLARQLGEVWDRLDVLVHAAGVYDRGPIATAPAAGLDAQYRVNVRAAYLLTQRLLPQVRPERGDIVFVNSAAGLRAAPTVGAYAATKHALRAVADALRDEVNHDGIRVLSVFVGRTATPLQARVHALEGRPYDPAGLLRPDDVARTILEALRLPRTAEVTDIRIRPRRAV